MCKKIDTQPLLSKIDKKYKEVDSHTFNHRIVLIDGMFGICEVSYKGLGEIEMWTGNMTPMSEDIKELGEDLHYFVDSFKAPILKQVGEDEFARLVLWEVDEHEI